MFASILYQGKINGGTKQNLNVKTQEIIHNKAVA